jgi:anti-sigma factor RsiW
MKPADERVKEMMSEVPGELELMAYADGELDAAAAARVRAHVASNPAAANKVALHNKLREAGRRAAQGIAVPPGLLQRVEALAAAQSPERAATRTSDAARPRWRIGFRMAVAAVLVLGVSLAVWMQVNGGADVVRGSAVVPVEWVSSTSKVHINCAKHEAHFAPQFSRTLHELPGSLREYLGHDATCPDLSKLGYEFVGCGPCTVPGGKTAHLLYKHAGGGGGGPVSLFVQLDKGQLPLADGKVYLSKDAGDGTEMIIWRGQGVVYYLVGENDEQLTSAAGEMGVKVHI